MRLQIAHALLCLVMAVPAFAQTAAPAPPAAPSAFSDTTVTFGLTPVALPNNVKTLTGIETDVLLNVSTNNVFGETSLISSSPFIGGRYVRLLPGVSKWIQSHTSFVGGHFQAGVTTSLGVVKASSEHYGERVGFVLNYAPAGNSTFGLGVDVEENNFPGIEHWVPSIALAPTFHF
jgi:hypothetical protein